MLLKFAPNFPVQDRLELAMEGHRFFNLVRWDKADKVINSYLEVEKTKRSHLMNAQFKAGTHEYWPIPQRYIDGTPKDLVTQNTGY